VEEELPIAVVAVQGVENSTAEVAEDSSLVAAVERVDSPYIPNKDNFAEGEGIVVVAVDGVDIADCKHTIQDNQTFSIDGN
jgi:hypothetical protein